MQTTLTYSVKGNSKLDEYVKERLTITVCLSNKHVFLYQKTKNVFATISSWINTLSTYK